MDPFASPEGLRDYEPGTWPAAVSQTADCGCFVRQGEPVGRYRDALMCVDCLEQEWSAQRLSHYDDGHGGIG